jgi:hypothetical protein
MRYIRPDERVQRGFAPAIPRRISVALTFACLILSGCAREHTLTDCWSPEDLKAGTKFIGEVIILSNEVSPPVMLPISCEKPGVVATLPDGVSISALSQNGRPRDSMGSYFYRAVVEGAVTDQVREGRPFVIIKAVEKVRGIDGPAWLEKLDKQARANS